MEYLLSRQVGVSVGTGRYVRYLHKVRAIATGRYPPGGNCMVGYGRYMTRSVSTYVGQVGRKGSFLNMVK